jgi:N-6 DNA Methylase
MKLKHLTLGFVAVGSLTFFSVSYLTIPRRVARLVAELCRPERGMSCYDPCCGSGRLPRAVQCAVTCASDDRIQICAQEVNPIPFLVAVVNRTLHHLNMNVKRGFSLRHPAFMSRVASYNVSIWRLLIRCGISRFLKLSTAVIDLNDFVMGGPATVAIGYGCSIC